VPIDKDPLESVKRLREDYERALDAAESHRAAYHDAVLELHRTGMPLREIAAKLGLSHQRVHQIVTSPAPERRKLGKAAAGVAAAILVAGAILGGLSLTHEPPFGASRPLAGPLLERIVMEARTQLGSLGDQSVDTAEIFGPAPRLELIRASEESPYRPPKASIPDPGGYYLIVLRGSFVCGWCSAIGAVPGHPWKPPHGTLVTIVWSPSDPYYFAAKDFTSGDLLPAVWQFPGPLTVGLA
jgi:lambda repressor-like predicted transcriptional regulator